MVWTGAAAPPADLTLEAVPLRGEHVPQMCALAELTRPGPFDTPTIEFGEYFGVFEGDRLVAMAGERVQDRHFREVSASARIRISRAEGWRGASPSWSSGASWPGRDAVPARRLHQREGDRLYKRMGFDDRARGPGPESYPARARGPDCCRDRFSRASANAARAAAIVASTWRSVCAADRNHASNCDGGR